MGADCHAADIDQSGGRGAVSLADYPAVRVGCEPDQPDQMGTRAGASARYNVYTVAMFEYRCRMSRILESWRVTDFGKWAAVGYERGGAGR
jgi:hypothetical protein